MTYEIKDEDDGFFVKCTWKDGMDWKYGPFSTLEYAEGFIEGFSIAIDCEP